MIKLNIGRPGRLGRCPIEHDDYSSVLLRAALALVRLDYARRPDEYADDHIAALGDLSRWLALGGLYTMSQQVGLVRHWVLGGTKLVDIYDEHKALVGPARPAGRYMRRSRR